MILLVVALRTLRALLPLALIAGVAAGCGGTATSPPANPGPVTPPAGPAPDGPVTISGNERIGWSQEVAAGTNIRDYHFAAFVDARRTTLPDIQCSGDAGPSGHACSAQLPFLTDGRHTIRIVASRVVDGREPMSDRSDELIVIKGTATSTVVADVRIPSTRVPEGGEPVTQPDREGMIVAVVATNLSPVTDLAALPDGRVLIAEREGRLQVIADGTVAAVPMASIQGIAQDGGGLMSVAPHPGFALNHLLYLLYAADTDRGVMYRLARGREVDGVLGELAVLGDLAHAERGGSGVLRFAADGRLYMVLSDLSADNTASEASYRGKVLRFDEEGRTPDDSPGGSPIVSSGHRLASGLAAGARGRLFEAETAHSGRINIIRQGARYAASAGEPGAAPLADLGPAARLGGLIVYSGRAFPRWQGDLLVARLDGEGITRLPVDRPPTEAAPIANLSGVYGRIRSLVEAADGTIYFGTANREPAGSSTPQHDDRVIRLMPSRPDAPRARRVPES